MDVARALFHEGYLLGMLEPKGLPVGTVQYLSRGHRPTPDLFFATKAFVDLTRKIDS